jgi:hypothetical protein
VRLHGLLPANLRLLGPGQVSLIQLRLRCQDLPQSSEDQEGASPKDLRLLCERGCWCLPLSCLLLSFIFDFYAIDADFVLRALPLLFLWDRNFFRIPLWI